MKKLTFCVLPERLAVCQLASDAALPRALMFLPFWSATRTHEEFSLVIPEDRVLAEWKCEPGWRCLKIQGPLEFSLVGILAGVSATLATAEISVFVISTFDTDYLLVRGADLDKAIEVLSSKGHDVRTA